jgi:hypothetical protein
LFPSAHTGSDRNTIKAEGGIFVFILGLNYHGNPVPTQPIPYLTSGGTACLKNKGRVG